MLMNRSVLSLFSVMPLVPLVLVGCIDSASDDSNVPADPTKDDVRQIVSDGKADHIDWCALFGWYGDDICDEFCSSPDPDCELTCRDAECGPQPEFQPRICLDGTFIFPQGTCGPSETGVCGWSFEADDCPEDRVCTEAECGIQPEFQPRICLDGSFIFPKGTCEANQNGNCGWSFEADVCPEDE